MFDGLKMQDVALLADCNGVPTRLTFGALVDEQTGFILDPTRRAIDRGLIFRLVPRRTGQGYRVEVKGSLHKFHNYGEHNADQFTATDLLHTLDQLVTTYGIDPFTSKINTVEFGVNVVLPFPVAHVLQNLVSYKNKPFTRDTHSKTPYYECRFQRFTVKLYDKGKQRGLDDNLLRVEIKVAKMIYFDRTGVHLNTLADLLKMSNYEHLGALLVDTFSKILFDDPTINPNNLTPRKREIYQNGRNPRYWQIPDDLPAIDRPRLWKQLQRAEHQYRALLNQHQQGNDWQTQTTALIGQTWKRLTTVTDQLLTQIDDHRARWQNLTNPTLVSALSEPNHNRETTPPVMGKCPLLTDLSNSGQNGQMSTFNPLCSGLQPDPNTAPTNTEPGAAVCPVTGVLIGDTSGRGGGVRRFVSAAMLHNDDDLLMRLNSQFGQYAKGSKEDDYTRTAHNVRNTYNNPRHNSRNNLKRSINKIHRHPTLFDVTNTLRLADDQRALLAGTYQPEKT